MLTVGSAITIVVCAAIVGVVYASFVEWALHKYVMHRPILNFRYAYEAHDQTHHKIFGWDHTYHCQDESQAYLIKMAWWNKYVLIVGGLVPFVALGASLAQFGWTAHIVLACVVLALVFSLYYGAYEYIHWCFHLPRKRRIEMWNVFRRLNGHHVLHHRNRAVNFNVVLPLADFVLRTLLVRAKKPFAQPIGESVPNVQPLSA